MTTAVGRNMTERSYLSIREVLDLLIVEFPEVTISKIRYLESRGLIRPERTPSGYRKFYESDVDRLRLILRQQRDHFLPLDVIRGRLDRGEGTAPNTSVAASLFDSTHDAAPIDRQAVSAGSGSTTARVNDEQPVRPTGPFGLANPMPTAPMAVPANTDSSKDEPAAGGPPAAPAHLDAPEEHATGESPETGQSVGPPDTGTPKARATHREGPVNRGTRQRKASESLDGELSADELARTAGIPLTLVQELVEFGMISGRDVAGVQCFDERSCIVARIAGGFAKYGIEARHLKALKHAAEREAGLFAQVVSPLLRQRNPEARDRARRDITDLEELGIAFHDALVRSELHDFLGG